MVIFTLHSEAVGGMGMEHLSLRAALGLHAQWAGATLEQLLSLRAAWGSLQMPSVARLFQESLL